MMPFNCLEEAFDEGNLSKPFVGRYFEKNAEFKPLLLPPISVFASMPSAQAKFPNRMEKCEATTPWDVITASFKARKCLNERGG